MKNILLIGFMGVGKGSLARELSKKTDFIAIDTDDLIESFDNRKVKKIFEEDGESYFRGLEQKVANWLESHVKNTIISTGGGFFAVDNLNKIGTVVFLQSDFDAILKRMLEHPKADKKLKKRPLFQDSKKAKELFNLREPIYTNKADIIIKVADRTPSEIADEILTCLRNS